MELDKLLVAITKKYGPFVVRPEEIYDLEPADQVVLSAGQFDEYNEEYMSVYYKKIQIIDG